MYWFLIPTYLEARVIYLFMSSELHNLITVIEFAHCPGGVLKGTIEPYLSGTRSPFIQVNRIISFSSNIVI
jgi:hypothetical protein